MTAEIRMRKPLVGGDPLSLYVADQWLLKQASNYRTGGWSGLGPMPPFLAGPESQAVLEAEGDLGVPGKWAPTSAGTYLWAVYKTFGAATRMNIYEISDQTKQQTSSTGGSGSSSSGYVGGQGSSSGGLPPGAPPANGRDPLGRLRVLMRQKGIR